MCEKYYNTAVYIRLSREDGDKAESDSVSNQKKLILDFIGKKDEFVVYDMYIDDGFSGTNFRRPGFERLIRDVEAGRVNCVIVKDLSRFGRDYIETGRYLERVFPEYGVRFLSIMDQIDSEKQIYDMLLPIKNIFNEQYARDISQKIHASLQTKQRAGEFIGAFPPYGYRKSPENKNRLVIDEYAAQIVRRVFELYLSGCGKIRIAGILNEEGILCPSEYKRQNGENYRNGNGSERASFWTYTTIDRMLQNETYIGNMVQGRKIQSMRDRAKRRRREDWIVVKGTHETIISPDTWEQVQKLLNSRVRERAGKTGENMFAGILKCGSCNCAMVRKNGKTREKGERQSRCYCGTYVRSGRRFCTPHSISYNKLEDMVWRDMQKTAEEKSGRTDRNRTAADGTWQEKKTVGTGKEGRLNRAEVLEKIERIIVYEDQKITIQYRERAMREGELWGRRETMTAYRKKRRHMLTETMHLEEKLLIFRFIHIAQSEKRLYSHIFHKDCHKITNYENSKTFKKRKTYYKFPCLMVIKSKNCCI